MQEAHVTGVWLYRLADITADRGGRHDQSAVAVSLPSPIPSVGGIPQRDVDADSVLTENSGLMTGLVSAPFIVNNAVSAELVQRILPDWCVAFICFGDQWLMK
jgi:hypothetical protein